jgi:hypothetical protein
MYITLNNLKKSNVETLQNMAYGLGLKIDDMNENNSEKYKRKLVSLLHLYYTNLFRRKTKKTIYIEENHVTDKNKLLSFKNNNNNFLNMYSYEPLNINNTDFRKYLIIKKGKQLFFIKKSDFKQSITSTNIFYKVYTRRKRRSNGTITQEKSINKYERYYRIPAPENYMITETDYIKLKNTLKLNKLTIIRFMKTNVILDEVISKNVANNGGTLVGSHHGPDYIYNVKFLV